MAPTKSLITRRNLLSLTCFFSGVVVLWFLLSSASQYPSLRPRWALPSPEPFEDTTASQRGTESDQIRPSAFVSAPSRLAAPAPLRRLVRRTFSLNPLTVTSFFGRGRDRQKPSKTQADAEAEDEDPADPCDICQEPLSSSKGHGERMKLDCGHEAHALCAYRWANSAQNRERACAMCRAHMEIGQTSFRTKYWEHKMEHPKIKSWDTKVKASADKIAVGLAASGEQMMSWTQHYHSGWRRTAQDSFGREFDAIQARLRTLHDKFAKLKPEIEHSETNPVYDVEAPAGQQARKRTLKGFQALEGQVRSFGREVDKMELGLTRPRRW